MAKLAAVLALLLCAATWAVHSETNHAGACTGAGVPYSVMDAAVIFEGWVAEIELIPDVSADGSTPNHRVRFDVTRGYREATAGESIETKSFLRLPGGVPSPCPTLTPEQLAGKYVMVGLRTTDSGDFYPFLTFYIQDAPNLTPADGSLSYDAAVRLAELVTDTNPERPLLTVEPSAARCGESVTFTGERFRLGGYLLAAQGGIPLARTQVTGGSGGRFEAAVRVPPCAEPHPEALPWVIEALPELPSPHTILVGAPEEYLSLRITGTVAPPHGDPRVEVAPGTTCGGEASVTGTGLAPNTAYPILGGNPELKSARTDADGRFHIKISIPAEQCDPAFFQRIVILYPGFEDFGSRFTLASTYFEVGAPPGPPNLGNTTPTSNPVPIPWLHLAGLTALILGASLLVARR